jgi:regulator of sirC expression with transglutaminase-like and TPR domain
MTEPADLLLFRHLVEKPDADLDLERAALLIAEAEYPDLDVASYVARLDRLAAAARRSFASPQAAAADAPPIEPVLEFLFRGLGFHGNAKDYYDPRNSFLNDVLERRTGIPITLAVVLCGVCRRLGIPASGVSFPGHFLVRTVDVEGQPLFVDPFEGRILDDKALRALYEQATGDPGDIDPDCLKPACRKQILARMLNNLRAIYEVRGDARRLRRVLERLAVLNPSDEIQSRLALLVSNAPLAPRLSVN